MSYIWVLRLHMPVIDITFRKEGIFGRVIQSLTTVKTLEGRREIEGADMDATIS